MATLTRLIPQETSEYEVVLDAQVPAPFPVEILEEERAREAHRAQEEVEVDPFADPPNIAEDESVDVKSSIEVDESRSGGSEEAFADEVLPSLAYVQQSCLMALNNVLSGTNASPMLWYPIVPPRRHSMPSRPEAELGNATAGAETFSSALQVLVSNLRNRDAQEMSEASSSCTDDSALIGELRRKVDSLANELSYSDMQLAQVLVSLLAHVNRLSIIDPRLSATRPTTLNPFSTSSNRTNLDIYDELSRQVMDLQSLRLDEEPASPVTATSSERKVEVSLLWSKIDLELETVSNLCRQRSEPAPRPYSPGLYNLPPDYDHVYDDTGSILPPEYEPDSYSHVEKEKAPVSDNEKMKMDFEAVTMAIDRLYFVAPQLHNQRVELRKAKLEELERAKLAGPSTKDVKGKEKDVRELDRILDLIGKASSRRLVDQSVVLDGDMKVRIEKAKQRDIAKREEFVESLIKHSHSRRIDSQDAVFQTNKQKDPEALLTLPEFIREQVPEEYREPLEQDPNALLSLPEAIKELPPPKVSKSPSPESPKLHKRQRSFTKRNRSLSAPPLAWLIPSLGRSSSPLRSPQPGDATNSTATSRRLTVRYVAEHHENLNHVLVFLGVDEGMLPGIDLTAEVIPGIADPAYGDRMILKCGTNMSQPLSLPLQVKAGRADIRVQGGHYEVKLPAPAQNTGSKTVNGSVISNLSGADGLNALGEDLATSLLDATQMTNMAPTSFICSSCSLALVQSQNDRSPIKLTFHDLPSEHWTELLDAWMCHHDQKLHDEVAKHGRGFWPKPSQALVGGSYFLFDESAIVKSNIRIVDSTMDEEWQRVQCICGAVVGRCQSHLSDEGSPSITYRLAKYGLRPVSPTAEPCRVPFSAFILEDMMELVRAHATYRFVVLDEEEERPRLLIWLFKPHMHLSYATTAQFALPRTGSVHAAKILFKLIGPETTTADLQSLLNKYPGFPQAERLLYPMAICHRLAALLKESNTSYPIGMRVMTGLLVGWLRRV